jgi:flagellar protein FlaG
MALDISSIQARPQAIYEMARQDPVAAKTAPLSDADEKLMAVTKEIDQSMFPANRRLAFSVNSKLDEVVVKVIDTDTDKVLREIPPVELQHVYERIREVIGLLFDRRA